MAPSSVIKECSSFLQDAARRPLYKLLPSTGEGFRKIKIRKRNKHEHMFECYFDMAFRGEYKDLRLRSLVAQTRAPERTSPDLEPFYIFPLNGYKILYNKQIDNYPAYISTLENIIYDTSSVEELLKTLFEHAYVQGNINEALDAGSDVLVYDIPYYYAIRKSLIESYDSFISG